MKTRGISRITDRDDVDFDVERKCVRDSGLPNMVPYYGSDPTPGIIVIFVDHTTTSTSTGASSDIQSLTTRYSLQLLLHCGSQHLIQHERRTISLFFRLMSEARGPFRLKISETDH